MGAKIQNLFDLPKELALFIIDNAYKNTSISIDFPVYTKIIGSFMPYNNKIHYLCVEKTNNIYY